MCYKFKCLLNLLIFFININGLQTFNVNFYYNYNLKVQPFNTQIYKRELTQFFEKASFSLKGFEKVESIPVLFPIDICIFNLEGLKYATALHIKSNGARYFKVFKMNNGSYELIFEMPAPNGIAMDCINFNNKGYVAIALNLSKPVKNAKEGSPIYEITDNHLRAVQYFAAPNLISIYLRVSGNDFFLLQAYTNSKDTPNLYCPYFKWSGSSFNKMGRIPCSNARQMTPFSIDYESYVAVANYADQKGRTATNSEIYKFSRDKNKFVLFQRIKTYGAVDVQYFSVPYNEAKRHFLVFGNSISIAPLVKQEKSKRENENLEADSVFYIFDKGQFIPYQKLSLYAIKKFLPVENIEAEKFILLVACTDQDIKIYNLNDWKFEESNIQFTEGALSKGVSNMRIYQENEKSFLIIANELMTDNETNIFLPIFKQEEHASALRQQIIEWANVETQRLEAINIKVLRRRVEEKFKRLEQDNYLPSIQDIRQVNVHTVVTESLVYPKLKMSSNYWTALGYVSQALDILEEQLKNKKRIKRDIDDTNHENLGYIYETLNVKTLTAVNALKAKRINELDIENPQFKNIKAQKVIVKDKYIKPTKDYIGNNKIMEVRNLEISGKLNKYLWDDLFNNTLKRKEKIQFVKAPIQIVNLKTDTIVMNNDEINEQNLGALIPIDGGKYVINQDIQFSAPITANEVNIFDRLNNLHVFNGQFDVLLKKSNKTQVIEGLKNVTNIKVLEPMTVTSKMMGPQLEAITPKKFINDPLILEGNFMINNNVHINHQLNTLDIIELKKNTSLKQVLDMGIRMDKSLKDVNLKFLQPIKANNSLVSFVNRHDLQRLIKLNQDDIQIIEGVKIFNESLEIKTGFSEVKNLNGVDIEKLEQNTFLKNTNQTIKVPMKLGKITVKKIKSPKILLNNKNLSNYLIMSGNQSIQGSLIVDNLIAHNLKVKHLNTDNKIFQQNLNDIYQQKARNAPQGDVFRKNRKFHGSIYVQNLILNTTINNKAVEEIENQLLQLEGNIKYVGNFKFNYAMNIRNMAFHGKLNGILAKDFGKCWLQKEADKQEFTAAQTFATINADKGIQLLGKLNGFTMDDFYTKTYWINRNEYLRNVNFENPIEIIGSLITQTLNKYLVPQNILHKEARNTPIIINSLTVDKDVIVQGNIHNITSINDINIYEFKKFLDSTNDGTLYAEFAYFSQSIPLYKTLNGHYITKTLDTVWLTNENVVLPHHIEIADAYFEGLLEFKGSINNMNLDYLKENYFSKTKPQKISVEIVFSEGTICVNQLNVNELHVFGPLIEGNGKTSFNFNEFVQNTLKTSGHHVISGNWSLKNAIVQGNINHVLVNKLNLADDIVHKTEPMQVYEIKAPKIFKNVHIENLYANVLSQVNKIPVAQWIRDAVYLYENYTVKGTTTISSLHVYNNLIVLGKLNNITYNEHYLLLKNAHQRIPGKMKIISHLAAEKRFLTNNIENLYAGYINQQEVSKFIENLIPANVNTEIKNHLIFKYPLNVENYEGPDGFLAQNQLIKRNINDQVYLSRANVETTDEISRKFNLVKENLKNFSKHNIYKIDHFDIIQTIELQFAKVFTMSLKTSPSVADILIGFEMQKANARIYKWIPEMKHYKETKDYYWLPDDIVLLKIIQKRFEIIQQPVDVEYLKTFVKQDLKIIYEVLGFPQKLDYFFEFINETCVMYQHPFKKSMQIVKYCLNLHYTENVIYLRNNIKQVLKVNQNLMAFLANSSVLIYNTTSNYPTLLQKLPTPNPEEIIFGNFNNIQYLAVLSYTKSNTLNHGFVEIYRSINASDFILFQILECAEPIHIKFSFIKKSNDFLLHLLSDSLTMPYIIYQYQGVMGFQEVLSYSILPKKLISNQALELYYSDQHLVALLGQDRLTIIEIALKQIL